MTAERTAAVSEGVDSTTARAVLGHGLVQSPAVLSQLERAKEVLDKSIDQFYNKLAESLKLTVAETVNGDKSLNPSQAEQIKQSLDTAITAKLAEAKLMLKIDLELGKGDLSTLHRAQEKLAQELHSCVEANNLNGMIANKAGFLGLSGAGATQETEDKLKTALNKSLNSQYTFQDKLRVAYQDIQSKLAAKQQAAQQASSAESRNSAPTQEAVHLSFKH